MSSGSTMRRMKQSGLELTRSVGTWGRRMPAPVRGAGRRMVAALPEVRGVRGLKRVLLAGAAGAGTERLAGRHHPRAARRMIPLGMAGTTYTQQEISTFLQMESALLRTRLFELTADAPASEHVLGGSASPVSAADADDSAAASAAGRRYLELHAQGTGDATSAGGPRHLVLVSVYPREGAEYGNGFVHRRVQYYRQAGAEVHVAVIAPGAAAEVYTYDGVHVVQDEGVAARHLLRSVDYTSVSVHSLSPYMWDQIEQDITGQHLYCFMHGFESRRWIRTLHNYRDAAAVQEAVADTLQRQRMWRRVVEHPTGAAGFLFVSEWWRSAAQEDMELVFPGARSHVVHNLVEPSVFEYVSKDPEQRFSILWVRSANSLNYGSDLAVRVLEKLRASRHWSRLTVRIVGDGRHFGAFEEAFGDDPRVTVERRFLSQEGIAALHREHGIFLVPTRLDSQGVSRDEAMSSGMVPVTNSVAAVSEFVDETCAVVAEPEDVDGMVRGIIGLLQDPDRFLAMSAAAARQAQRVSGPSATVLREMEIMGLIDPEQRSATRLMEGH